MMKRRILSAAALAAACAMTLFAFPAMAGGTDDTGRQVTVSATGTVMEVPDMAQITFSVVTEGSEASEAQTENSQSVKDVMDVLAGLGVDEGSVQTSDYYIDPEYDYDSDPARLTGYRVRTTLTVSDQKIEDTGKLLEAVVDAGVNDVGSIVYTCSTYDEKYQEALTLAVEAAKVKADTLARAAGATVGQVVLIQEGWQDTSARYQESGSSAFSMKTADMASDEASALDLNPGSLQIQANVSVTYAID